MCFYTFSTYTNASNFCYKNITLNVATIYIFAAVFVILFFGNVVISAGAGTRLPEFSTRIRLFLGHPNPTFPGRVGTRPYPNPTF